MVLAEQVSRDTLSQARKQEIVQTISQNHQNGKELVTGLESLNYYEERFVNKLLALQYGIVDPVEEWIN